MAGSGEVDAQVAGAAGEVEDPAAARQRQLLDGAASPAAVEPERHHPVDEVVAGGDGVEHAAHRLHLLVAGRQHGTVPGRSLHRHGCRLRSRQ